MSGRRGGSIGLFTSGESRLVEDMIFLYRRGTFGVFRIKLPPLNARRSTLHVDWNNFIIEKITFDLKPSSESDTKPLITGNDSVTRF